MTTTMKITLIIPVLAATIVTVTGASCIWAQESGQPLPSSSVSTFNLLGPDAGEQSRAGDDSLLSMFGQRLELGPIDLGLRVAPRRPSLSLDIAPRSSGVGAMSLYRLTDTDLRTTDIGLDLRLRWPSVATSEATALSHLEPYVSLGPTISVTATDDVAAIGRLASRTDRAMSLGMHGALGLHWRLTNDSSLFGEYRMTQDRQLGTRTTTGEFGVDLFYGFSVKF